MKRVVRTNQELCDAVYQAVAGAGKPVSRREVAEIIGTTKNPNMIKMLEQLVTSGFLFKVLEPDKFGRMTNVYTTNLEAVQDTQYVCADAS